MICWHTPSASWLSRISARRCSDAGRHPLTKSTYAVTSLYRISSLSDGVDMGALERVSVFSRFLPGTKLMVYWKRIIRIRNLCTCRGSYLPNGVINVGSRAEDDDRGICQNPELHVASSFVNTRAPANCASIGSITGSGCL